jgi:hypothetical protein
MGAGARIPDPYDRTGRVDRSLSITHRLCGWLQYRDSELEGNTLNFKGGHRRRATPTLGCYARGVSQGRKQRSEGDGPSSSLVVPGHRPPVQYVLS